MNSNPESIRRGIQRMDSREWRGGIPPSFSRDSNLSLSRDGFSLQQGAPSPRRGRAPSGFVSSGKAAMADAAERRMGERAEWMIAEYASEARATAAAENAALRAQVDELASALQTTEASIGARLEKLEGLLVKAFPALREGPRVVSCFQCLIFTSRITSLAHSHESGGLPPARRAAAPHSPQELSGR